MGPITKNKERLNEKLEKEYGDFLKSLEEMEPKEIIKASYEKVMKEDVLYAMEENDLTDDQVSALLESQSPLEDIYQQWLKMDCSYMSDLKECIFDHASRLAEKKGGEKMSDGRDELYFEIVEQIGVIAKYPTGWRKEFNLVSWNGNEPRYDIRDWSPDHAHMSRGVTLSKEEMNRFKEIIKEREAKEIAKPKHRKEKDHER